MSNQANIDIDYEHLDDLPLSDHFEWHYFHMDDADIDKKNDDELNEWQTASQFI